MTAAAPRGTLGAQLKGGRAQWIGAALQTLFGGNITLYTQLCERACDDAYELMLRHAREMGANAVIGVRYDAVEVGPGITEVLAYGTAVKIDAME